MTRKRILYYQENQNGSDKTCLGTKLTNYDRIKENPTLNFKQNSFDERLYVTGWGAG